MRQQWTISAALRRLCLIGAALLALAVFNPIQAEACTCAEPRSPSNEFGIATAVFTGTALTIEPAEDPRSSFMRWLQTIWFEFGFGAPPTYPDQERKVTFQANAAWKGVTDGTVTVKTGRDLCGYEFTVGDEYLVYAPGGSTLQTSLCRRTRPIANASDDLTFLSTMPVSAFPRTARGPSRLLYVVIAMAVSLALLAGMEWKARRRAKAGAV